MRLLYFTRDYTPHDHRFLSALSQTSHEVYSLRLEQRGRLLEDRPLPANIHQINWRGGQGPFHWRDLPSLTLALRALLKQIKPDLVHAGPIQNTAYLTALAGFRPLVSMSWGSDLLRDADSSALMRFLTRFTLQRSSVLVGDCQAVQRKAAEYGFREERCVLFPWGINLQQFCPGPAGELRARLGWQDAFVVLSLRSWEPIYGVDGVVRAFARAAQQVPELRLMLLSGGSMEKTIHKLLDEHQLRDRVYLGGRIQQDDLPNYYRSADLYLSASHSDGSSVSLMEALGCGLPVLVSNIPGNREWIEPERQGWWFDDNDEEQMAARLVEAARQRNRFPVMAQAARQLAEERADWNKNFLKLETAYRLAAGK